MNRVIKQYLRTDRLVDRGGDAQRRGAEAQLASDDASPMTYNSPKPEEITEEDKLVEKWPLGLKAEDIKVIPVSEVFQ